MNTHRVPAYFVKNYNSGKPEILDILSVLSGFRKVGVIALPVAGKPPFLERQIKDLEGIANLAGNFSLITYTGYGARCGLFVFAEEARQSVLDFIRQFPKFPDTAKGDTALGLLLSYPACCVRYARNFKSTDAELSRSFNLYEKFPLIPFAPCSEKCAEPWQRHYEGLLAKVVWV